MITEFGEKLSSFKDMENANQTELNHPNQPQSNTEAQEGYQNQKTFKRAKWIFFGPSFFENHRKVNFLILLLLLLLLPISFLIAKKITQYRSEANTAQAIIFISPDKQTLPPGAAFQVMVDSKQYKVGYVRTQITFNPRQLQLSREIEIDSPLKNAIIRTSLSGANQTGVIDLVVGAQNTTSMPTGIFKVATLSFQTLGSESVNSNITIIQNKTQIISQDTSPLVVEVKNASLALNPAFPLLSPGTQATVTPSPLPSSPSTSKLTVNRVVMVNTRTGEDIQTVDTGTTFTANIATLPLYTFRFEPNSDLVKSVKYEQTANYRPTPITHIDNKIPYSAVGYGNGKYYPWDVGVGDYTIIVTPYDQLNAQGQVGTPLTFKVHVVNEVQPSPTPKPVIQVSKVIMVNTETGQDIQTLDTSKPVTISISSQPKYTFRYETNMPTGSVKHEQTANYRPTPISHIDNAAPYSAVGYGFGKYYPWDVGVGQYTLTITPYTQANGQGEAGQPLQFGVTVVE